MADTVILTLFQPGGGGGGDLTKTTNWPFSVNVEDALYRRLRKDCTTNSAVQNAAPAG